MRRHDAAVEARVGARALGNRGWMVEDDVLLFRIPPDTLVRYALGEGLAVDAGPATHPAEIDLFCEGSIAAAVAALNGLYPFHGSSVVRNGHAIVFTGPSGAGKTTLCAALALAGYPLLADDLCVLEEAERGPPVVLPGRKQPKLWPDALDMTGAARGARVSPEYGKHFVEGLPRATTAVPLGAIVLLEQGRPGEPVLEPLTGGEAIAAWSAEHYCTAFLAAARGWDRAAIFRDAAAKAHSVPAWRLRLPRAAERFSSSLDFARTALERIAP